MQDQKRSGKTVRHALHCIAPAIPLIQCGKADTAAGQRLTTNFLQVDRRISTQNKHNVKKSKQNMAQAKQHTNILQTA